jgi:hypothetical protein
MQTSNLARIALQNLIAHRYLAVTTDHNMTWSSNGKNGCGVE